MSRPDPEPRPTRRLRLAVTHVPQVSQAGIPEVDSGVIQNVRAADANYRTRINPLYPLHQAHVTHKRRAVLIDWLMDVSRHYSLKRDSFHGGIQLLDRYLSLSSLPVITKSDLQLIGITSLWISTKLEESTLPSVNDFSHSTGEAFSADSIRAMERKILTALDFDVLPLPTAYDFVCYFLHQLALDGAAPAPNAPTLFPKNRSWMKETLVNPAHLKYIMELLDTALLDLDSLCFTPSKLAAASLTLCLDALGLAGTEEATLERITGHSKRALINCIEYLQFALALQRVPGELVQENVRRQIPSRELYCIQHHNPHALDLVESMQTRKAGRLHPAARLEIINSRTGATV